VVPDPPHAGTFAGSARACARSGRPAQAACEHAPACAGLRSAVPSGMFHAATRGTRVPSLVHPRAGVAPGDLRA
jgi:hypothetical protein